MTLAVLASLWRVFLRDRGAVAFSVLLPLAFFLVFAAIFAGASGDVKGLRVAIGDQGQTTETKRLVRALIDDTALQPVVPRDRAPSDDPTALTGDEVRALVKGGSADVGLIIRGAGEGRLLMQTGLLAAPPLTIVSDPQRKIATQILLSLVQQRYLSAMPDVALSESLQLFEQELAPLNEDQRTARDEALQELRDDLESRSVGGEGGPDPSGAAKTSTRATDAFGSIEIESVVGRRAGQNQIAYYAGAVAVMFMLFAAASGSASLLDEKEAGVLDRLLVGPRGLTPLLAGRFFFLVTLGVAQVTVIFVAAWTINGVDLPRHLVGYALTTLATASACAAIGLALTAACETRRQAMAFTSIVILIISAVGGSMVPRFLMPAWVQAAGFATPNTWALEAYTRLFWREEPLTALLGPLVALTLFAVVGLVAARVAMRRWERI